MCGVEAGKEWRQLYLEGVDEETHDDAFNEDEQPLKGEQTSMWERRLRGHKKDWATVSLLGTE